jgi:predicted alpha/beta superfamily hydrolase
MLSRAIRRLVPFTLAILLFACQALPVSPQNSSSLLTRQAVAAAPGSTLTGTFRTHRQIPSQFLKYSRDVLVYLPPGYDRDSSERYPVIYMHDGNNLFDRRTAFGGAEWQVDEALERLYREAAIQPVIVVGVYNTPARLQEYTWEAMNLDGALQGGQGSQYGRFLVEELKPLIDKTYRTRPDREHTGVMGSSLGGLISFYLGLHYPHVFKQIGMVSPSIWWKDRVLLQEIPKLSRDLKIWLDMGSREGQNPEAMLADAQKLARALEQQGYQHFENLAFHVAEGAGHNEQAWAERIDRPFRFFYGKNQARSTGRGRPDLVAKR